MNRNMILRRVGQALLVLFVTYTLAFFLLSALPSDGVAARYASPDLGLSLSEIDAIRDQSGTNKPLLVQYFTSLAGFLTGNFGFSVQTGTAVSTMIASALPGTLLLAGIAFAGSVLLAGAIAAVASSERFEALAQAFRALPSLMISLPAFWVGIVLIQLVSFQLGWVPVIDPSPAQSLVLPALTLMVPISAPLAQVLIRSIDDVKHEPFIQAVRARGASEPWIFWRNVLRGAMAPTMTMAGLLFGELVGGAVVTEAVFARKGLGSLTVDAVAYRDTPVLLAVVLISATAYVVINLAVDLLYPVLDPRLRRKVTS